MKALTAREILRREYGSSRNFMTPNVIRVGKINRETAYELAQGYGLDHEPIYGVSVARFIPDANDGLGETERVYDSSSLFHSLEDAEAHIAALKGES